MKRSLIPMLSVLLHTVFDQVFNAIKLMCRIDPIIFRGLKKLGMDDPQQQTILKLAAEGISVYSPHTALDAASPGLADWLVDVVEGEGKVETIQQKEGHGMMGVSEWNIIAENSKALGVGYGRVKYFDKPIAIETVIEDIKSKLRLDSCKSTGSLHF